jgi:hypothetical protein
MDLGKGALAGGIVGQKTPRRLALTRGDLPALRDVKSNSRLRNLSSLRRLQLSVEELDSHRPRLLVNGVTIHPKPVGAEQGKALTPRGRAGTQELVVLYAASQQHQLRARDMPVKSP